jgi:hypothetical protein
MSSASIDLEPILPPVPAPPHVAHMDTSHQHRTKAMLKQRQKAGANVVMQESWRAPNVMWLSTRTRPARPTLAQRRAEAQAREAVLRHVYEVGRWWWGRPDVKHDTHDARLASHAQLVQLIIEHGVQRSYDLGRAEDAPEDADLYKWMARWLLHVNPAHAAAEEWPYVPRMGSERCTAVVEGEAHTMLMELSQLGQEDINIDLTTSEESMDVLWAAFPDDLEALGYKNPNKFKQKGGARKWCGMDPIPHVGHILETRYLTPLQLDLTSPQDARAYSEAVVQDPSHTLASSSTKA